MDRKVVITGLGAVSPLGLTAKQMWENICQGNSGIQKIKAFDASGFLCKVAGEVTDYKIRNHVPKFHRKATKLMSRDIELAVIAANDAIESSGLITKATDPDNVNFDPRRMAINIGAGLISCELIELAPAIAKSINNGEFDLKLWGTQGLPLVTPLWLLKYLPNMLDCHVGIIHDIQGPGNNINCGEVSSHLSISEARQIILRNNADLALAGGGEAKVNPIVMARQCLLKRTSPCDNPEQACKPFDQNASGSVFGEGAGLVVIEDFDHANNRSAEIYAEIAGIGESTNLTTNFENLENDAKGLQIAIENAIEEAGITANMIDLISPHGTGIPQDDKAETTAIFNALGDSANSIPVLPTKSFVSNTGAASGGIDIVIACYAMKEGIIPAVKNFEKCHDGFELNIVKEKITKKINYVLCCSYTYGGQVAAVILKNLDGKQ